MNIIFRAVKKIMQNISLVSKYQYDSIEINWGCLSDFFISEAKTNNNSDTGSNKMQFERYISIYFSFRGHICVLGPRTWTNKILSI